MEVLYNQSRILCYSFIRYKNVSLHFNADCFDNKGEIYEENYCNIYCDNNSGASALLSVSAFDNNDYGGGGGYDFGGGDYGGYDYGGNDYDSSSYSGDADPVSVIIGIGIVVVIIIISTIGGNKRNPAAAQHVLHQ